jgi:hypothetical protein
MSSYHGRSHPDAAEQLLSRAPEDEFRSRLHGVYFARVKDIDDPEKQGRIKVTFHWLEEEGEAEMTTGWLTRCVPFVGPTNMKRQRLFGMNWPLPEVGSLVVIGFNGGDVHDGVFFGQPEYLENDVGAPPTEKDKNIDWSLRLALQNGSEFGFDTEGNCYMVVTGNLRVRVLGSAHISAKGVITVLATKVRNIALSVLRLLGVTIDQTNYPRPDEAGELREMMIDAMKHPPGRKDPGIGKIRDIE